MRIVIATENSQVGAAETYSFSLASELARAGDDVELWVYQQTREQAEEWVRESGAQIIVVPDETAPRLKFAFSRLRLRRPDVVHANQPVSPALIAARVARVAGRFVTDHMLPVRPNLGPRGEVLRRFTRASAQAVIVFSRQNAAIAWGTWKSTPAEVVYPGVPEPTCGRQRALVLGGLGVPADAVIVTSVGRLTEQKRMDVFLRALAKVGDPRIHGLIVGDGADRAALEKLAEGLGIASKVTFTGHRRDVGCLLRATDLYVQSSAWEGICFATLEAMATGLPCVVSDLPALLEAVGDVGAPSVPVAADEPLAVAIQDMLSDRSAAAALGSRLRARWGEVFTVEKMAEAHRGIYVRYLRTPRGSTRN